MASTVIERAPPSSNVTRSVSTMFESGVTSQAVLASLRAWFSERSWFGVLVL